MTKKQQFVDRIENGLIGVSSLLISMRAIHSSTNDPATYLVIEDILHSASEIERQLNWLKQGKLKGRLTK